MKGKKLGDFEWKNVMADGMQLAVDSGVLGPIERELLHLSLSPWETINEGRMKEDTMRRTGGKCGMLCFVWHSDFLAVAEGFNELRKKLEV